MTRFTSFRDLETALNHTAVLERLARGISQRVRIPRFSNVCTYQTQTIDSDPVIGDILLKSELHLDDAVAPAIFSSLTEQGFVAEAIGRESCLAINRDGRYTVRWPSRKTMEGYRITIRKADDRPSQDYGR